jgi:hypothetical protein
MSRRHKPERCRDWPHCGCGDRWQHWQETLKAVPPPQFTEEEIEEIKANLIFMLSCVAQFCPDTRLRRHAMLQLLRPIFAAEARHWIN